ncbi:protein scarlet [Nasonia vitripennis]|uniref:ABC-2 type transporter transmembrane domain-containing protein n=1 Tax=Nasonia vitripennis TaxID=7425 RepID=A0A7M7TEM5_NASVI|nr:protein scarlet [Nasonia vitripennis]
MIAQFSKKKHNQWDKYINELTFAFNSAISKSTGFSLAYLNYGRELTLQEVSMNHVQTTCEQTPVWNDYKKHVVAFLASMCFFGAINQDQLGIQAVQGVIFILISENTFFPMYGTLSLIPQQFSLFLREYEDGLYSVHVYYLSQVIALLPGLALESIVFTTIVYWLSDLSNSITEFCLTLFIILLTINVSTACGFFFSTSFENVALAMAYLVPFDYLLMITMGLFIKLSSLPIYIQWIKYISWLFYSTEAISIIQWRHVNNISCNNLTADFPCITNGEKVLELYDFSECSFLADIYSMIALYILFHLLGYYNLLKKCQSRNFF